MDNRSKAFKMLADLSDVKLTYIMHILQDVSKSTDQEVKDKLDAVHAFDRLSEYFQTLPKPWEDEEELYAEMSEERRKKRAMV